MRKKEIIAMINYKSEKNAINPAYTAEQGLLV